MSAKEARDKFSDILGRAYYRNEATIVEKQEIFRTHQVIDERTRGVDPAEIEREIAVAVAEVRRETNDTDSSHRP